jgi:hypothetical protein
VSEITMSALAETGAVGIPPPDFRPPTTINTTLNVDSFDMQMIGIVVQLAPPADDSNLEEK